MYESNIEHVFRASSVSSQEINTMDELNTESVPIDIFIGEQVYGSMLTRLVSRTRTTRMSETPSLKPLTKGTCLNDLVQYYQIELSNETPTKVAMKLPEIYKRAKEETGNRDEEKAFILYMRWLTCAKWVQKTDQYQKERTVFKPYIHRILVKEVLKVTEELSKNLKLRYKEMEENHLIKEENSSRNTDAAAAAIQMTPQTFSIENNVNDGAQDWVSCERLVDLIQETKSEMLLVDIRTNKEYQASRIKYEKCINIPANKIEFGVKPWDYGNCVMQQDEQAFELLSPFRKRPIEQIILLDNNSGRLSLIPDSPLNLLKNVLLKWDPGVGCKRISILDGGHNEMLRRFPTFMINVSSMTTRTEQKPNAAGVKNLNYRELSAEWDEEQTEEEEFEEQSQSTIFLDSKNMTGCSIPMDTLNLFQSSQPSTNTVIMGEVENLIEERRGMLTPKKDKSCNSNAAFEIINMSIKRSKSSPNLLQLDDNNGTPNQWWFESNSLSMDRSTSSQKQSHRRNHHVNSSKILTSSQAREQRMDPVFTQMQRGVTGLQNLGNSCYMNCILQCLSNTAYLAKYFIDGTYADDLNATDGRKTSGLVIEEFAQVIRALWSKQYRSITPREFKSAVGQYKQQFSGSEQEDCHEFLTFLLDWMHNDLKKNIKSMSGRSLSFAEKEWNTAIDGQSSIISQLFFGQLRSTVHCEICGKSSTTYQTFSTLTISLSSSIRCSLDDRIRIYMSAQKVSGWNCPSCKVARDAIKKFDFAKLAPIVVVHLSRFGDSEGYLEKKNTTVDFPLTSLNLQQYLKTDSRTAAIDDGLQQHHYNLYGVSNHHGTMYGGHYTAYCKNTDQNKWYHYDDSIVTEVSPAKVKSSTTSAYLLFYTCLQSSVG